MFGRIARRYDLMNSLLTLGQHRRWKDVAARACDTARGDLALDVCAGTADIALALARQGAQAVALDFSAEMLERGRRKSCARGIASVCGDALRLPFADHTFHAAAVGFSLRNVVSLPGLLSEMARVVRPGGWVVSLETSQPPSAAIRFMYHRYLRFAAGLAPLLSVGSAYRYLAETIIVFPGADEIADRLHAAGLREVSYRRLMLGAVAIHRGRVPAGPC